MTASTRRAARRDYWARINRHRARLAWLTEHRAGAAV